MSQIDNLLEKLKKYFHRLSGPNYVRLMDTPHAWGSSFDEQIMPHSFKRQQEFATAIIEIIKKARYRCDISSLNSPDADWRKIILQAIDNGLSKKIGRTRPTQFRFLFGQSPTVFLNGLLAVETGPFDYVAFKDELLELIQSRAQDWELIPEIWISRFFRLDEGMINSFIKNLSPDFLPINDTRMTWSHTKIIAVDGVESLVGGHNLNMDLFRNYPPVHDVSVIVHGAAALDAQCYLNEMWLCNSDLLKKEYFDVKSMSWQIGSELQGKPEDPLQDPVVMMSVTEQQKYLLQLHADIDNQCGAKGDDYSKIEEYKRADRILSVGKYWTGPNMNTDYHHGSEIMKEHLIKNARYMIRISQQDLISAWKKRWVDHTVCRWLIEALLANKSLQLHVVVSPLDAAAGAAGDQYSFGSGAERTFELLKYYITHDLDTDELLSDENGDRADALKRVLIAPFFFTDRLSEQQTTEGKTYQWPNLDLAAYTATLKQQPLAKKPPLRGIIGSSLMSTIEGSGFIYPKVPAAPANHAKLMIIDDELYVVGSDNLYPGHLSEFNYVVEGKKAVEELIAEYWQQVWKYSSPHVFPKLNQDLYCSSGNANQTKIVCK